MNDPWERIEILERQNKVFEDRLKRLEQQTEEIKTVKVEVASADVHNRLDNHLEFLKELDRKSDLHTGLINELRVDMQKRFDAIADVQKLILSRLPEKGE